MAGDASTLVTNPDAAACTGILPRFLFPLTPQPPAAFTPASARAGSAPACNSTVYSVVPPATAVVPAPAVAGTASAPATSAMAPVATHNDLRTSLTSGSPP